MLFKKNIVFPFLILFAIVNTSIPISCILQGNDID